MTQVSLRTKALSPSGEVFELATFFRRLDTQSVISNPVLSYRKGTVRDLVVKSVGKEKGKISLGACTELRRSIRRQNAVRSWISHGVCTEEFS